MLFYAGTMFVATTGQKKAYYAEHFACINIPSLRTWGVLVQVRGLTFPFKEGVYLCGNFCPFGTCLMKDYIP